RLAFASDPGVLGRSVLLGDTSYTIVGVLPADFWFPQDVNALLPLRITRSATDTGLNTAMIGRLKADVTARQAAVSTSALAERFRQESNLPYPLPLTYKGLTPISYQQWLTGDVRTILLVLFGGVGVLLLMACSNLASLVLARLAARRKEVALRLALG